MLISMFDTWMATIMRCLIEHKKCGGHRHKSMPKIQAKTLCCIALVANNVRKLLKNGS